MKRNILVGQSGGPTAVINASLSGVIDESRRRPAAGTVYGMENGIEGFLSGRALNLTEDLSDEELALLKLTPAAYLGSCRYKLPEHFDAPVYRLLFEKLRAMGIGSFFYIGGNDSMDTVDKLSRYAAKTGEEIRFIGVPKTIDNDLPVTDHTPGYASAAKYVAASVREIALDASVYRQPAVTLIELMGRHAGWLTAASALARKYPGDNPLLIYLPEAPFEMDRFFNDLERALKKRPDVVVCLSEGIKDKSGKLICEYASEAQVDTFGHKMLTGSAKLLESYVRARFGVKVRSAELNVSQRCSGALTSLTDIEEAAEAGRFALRSALNGETGKMVSFHRLADKPYQMACGLTDVSLVCNKEKLFPAEWITGGGCDIAPAFSDYLLPLIQGEAKRPMEDGLPKYLYRKETFDGAAERSGDAAGATRV